MNELIDKLGYTDSIIDLIKTNPDLTRREIRDILKRRYGRGANAHLTFLLQNKYIVDECTITDYCCLYGDMLYNTIIELEREGYEYLF